MASYFRGALCALAALAMVGGPLRVADAAARRPVATTAAPASPVLNSNNVAINGSSSSAGNADLSGITPSTLLRADTAGGSKTVIGTTTGSEALGGATPATTYTQVSGSTDLSATRIIQGDLNGSSIGQFLNIGGAEYNRMWLGQASVTGATHTASNQVLDLVNASVINNGRWIAWVGTQDGLGTFQFNQYRWERLVWADYPGHAVNMQRYMEETPKLTALDTDDALNYRRPHRLAISDFSHLRHEGSQVMEQKVFLPFVQSTEGGAPWCAQHRYFSNVSTAQTNGGAVTTLKCLGDATGYSAELLTLTGAHSADFKTGTITSSGGTVSIPVIRASATVLKSAYSDVVVHLWNAAGVQRYYRIGIGIGSLNKCACDELNVDGYAIGTLWSTDNAGTAAAPTFTTGASRNFKGFATGENQFSMILRIKPDAASDGKTLQLWFQTSSLQFQRVSTGAIRVTPKDDSAVAFGQLTSTTTSCTQGKVDSTCGAKWILYSANVSFGGTNLNRQRLMIVDDATLHVDYDSGVVHSTTLDARSTFSFNQLANTGALGLLWSNTSQPGQGYAGKVARWLMFNKEIDWTVGCASGTDCTGATNLALFRSGVGTLTDLGAAATGITGDGREVTVSNGGCGSTCAFNGALKPWFGISGNAADFLQGINLGTAGDSLPGDEPGNAALVGGVTWEIWEQRDWTSLTSTRGVPFSSLFPLLAIGRRRRRDEPEQLAA
jgi:hypothetical protein